MSRLNNRIMTEDSSFIKYFSYEPEKRVLEIATTTGGGNRYRFYNVPQGIFVELATSPSSGKTFNQFIKGSFKSRKLKVKQ